MSETGVRKILVADNDENVLLALEQILENGGYTTATAVSGKEACILLSEGGFDLLVLDDSLSDKDCVQFLSECRRSGITLLAIVTYNRFPAFDEEAQLNDLGVCALVNKHSHAELVGIVDYLLSPHAGRHRYGLESMT